MNTKLTLRMNEASVRKAKAEAHRRGKSVSGMVSEFFDSLGRQTPDDVDSLPPVTRSLLGAIRGKSVSEADYRRHLRQKFS